MSAILVLNSGSSSLKAGLFAADQGANFAGERALVTAQAGGIGQGGGRLQLHDAAGRELISKTHSLQSQEEALAAVAVALREHADTAPSAIGHRIVHGGPRLLEPVVITPEVLAGLRGAIQFAPLHLPGALRLVEQASKHYPGTPQVACFDTTFHRAMPPVARRLPIARAWAEVGVQRYGFHGLSYESVIAQLRAEPGRLPDRIVMAHLGSGSSLCAALRGVSVDTTMGMTPTGGIPMATRTGDLDPGALIFMARQGRLSPNALETEVDHRSGLAAISGGSGDMQQMEAAMRGGDADAVLAFSMFAAAVAKQVAALTVSLAGLDLLVFTGGIGEHSAALRSAVVDRLRPFGLRLDPAANAGSTGSVHAPGSIVSIRVLPAREDVVLAAHTRRLMGRA